MKKFVTASLLVFIAITSGVAIVSWISPDNKNNQPITGSNIDNTNQAGKITEVNATTSTLKLSSAELAKHNSAKSCWLLISGKIYDVTTFLPNHPGEAKAILPTCGADATQAFATKGKPGGKPHSGSANAMLADYYIGDLNQTVTTDPTNPTTPAIANPSATTDTSASRRDRGDDDEWEDD